MASNIGYIYIRTNEYWDSYDACKLGKANNILNRESVYITSEIKRGTYASVFEIELTDIAWSSRGIPAGVDETLDIATLTFSIPIWISPPAKVKRQTIIQQIIADIHKVNSVAGMGYDQAYADFFGTVADDAEVIITPGDYRALVSGATVTLIKPTGESAIWDDIIEMQGELTVTSLLKLNISNDSDSDENLIVGSVAANPLDNTSLIFNLDTDTLPANTLSNVDKIIDPRSSSPGSGLDVATLGQRYLITESISASGYPDWNVDADENDIIEYGGSSWSVVFDSSAVSTSQFITNDFTSKQYKWTGNSWISSYEGEYNPGYWRLVL